MNRRCNSRAASMPSPRARSEPPPRPRAPAWDPTSPPDFEYLTHLQRRIADGVDGVVYYDQLAVHAERHGIDMDKDFVGAIQSAVSSRYGGGIAASSTVEFVNTALRVHCRRGKKVTHGESEGRSAHFALRVIVKEQEALAARERRYVRLWFTPGYLDSVFFYIRCEGTRMMLTANEEWGARGADTDKYRAGDIFFNEGFLHVWVYVNKRKRKQVDKQLLRIPEGWVQHRDRVEAFIKLLKPKGPLNVKGDDGQHPLTYRTEAEERLLERTGSCKRGPHKMTTARANSVLKAIQAKHEEFVALIEQNSGGASYQRVTTGNYRVAFINRMISKCTDANGITDFDRVRAYTLHYSNDTIKSAYQRSGMVIPEGALGGDSDVIDNLDD